jgi:hypothetical protein
MRKAAQLFGWKLDFNQCPVAAGMKGDATHEAEEHKYRVRVNSLLCEGALLSAPSLARLKNARQAEYDAWKHTDFSKLELVYWWADGLYVKAGLADRKAALSQGPSRLDSGLEPRHAGHPKRPTAFGRNRQVVYLHPRDFS